MRRFALPVIAVLASSVVLGVTSVSAQTYGGAPVCAKDYKDFWEKLDRSRFAKMSGDQIANLSRTALRAYDACQAGDEQGSRALFESLPNPDDETGPGPFNPNLPR